MPIHSRHDNARKPKVKGEKRGPEIQGSPLYSRILAMVACSKKDGEPAWPMKLLRDTGSIFFAKLRATNNVKMRGRIRELRSRRGERGEKNRNG